MAPRSKPQPAKSAGVTPDATPPLESMAFTELGVSGLKQYAGILAEEELRELQGQQGQQRYREMQLDPTVRGCLRAIELLCRRTPWHEEPGGDTPEDEEAAKFLGEVREDMSQTWADFVAEALSMLVFGWSYAEAVYKVRAGRSAAPGMNSRFSDGRIGIRKLAFRSQDSLERWVFDESGGVRGLWQRTPTRMDTRFIPIEKALLFRTSTAKNTPEGDSILRGAFTSWWKKRRIENIEAIGIERNLNGIPVAWVPPRIMRSDASAEDQEFYSQVKKIVRNLRVDEQAGLCFPLAYDDKGNKLFDISLLTVSGKRDVDTDAVVKRYQLDIAMSMLADVLLVGHEKVGSMALASSKTTLFATAIGTFLDNIEEVLNRHLVPRLFELNGWELENLPRFKHGDIESADLGELGAYLTALTSAGAEVFPNFDLTQHLLELAGLPRAADHGGEDGEDADSDVDAPSDGGTPVVDEPPDGAARLTKYSPDQPRDDQGQWGEGGGGGGGAAKGPPSKAWKEPPAPTGTGGARTSGARVTRVKLGEATEAAVIGKLGMTRLIPPGRTQNPLDASLGDYAFEVRAISRGATEYKTKLKQPAARTARRKIAYAASIGKRPGTMLVIRDGNVGRVYWRPGIGNFRLTAGTRSEWNYAGRVRINVGRRHRER